MSTGFVDHSGRVASSCQLSHVTHACGGHVDR